MIDVIVVGSGASGVHAAWPLVHRGLNVLMIDGGAVDHVYTPEMKPQGFTELRQGDEDQHRYLLGDRFEGVPLGPVRVGAQLTPPRKHIADSANAVYTREDNDFHAMESLALGGLGAGWGAVSPTFSDDDIADWPIERRDLQPHYEAVARLVGISGNSDDDLRPAMGGRIPLLPPARSDSNGESLRSAYRQHRSWFHKKGMIAGDPWIALASTSFRNRGPCRYDDMEFWGDQDRAVYRPVYTLEGLRACPNFTYQPGSVVESFSEENEQVTVAVRSLSSGEQSQVTAHHLLLAAGALGSARLALRSRNAGEARLPLVCNPYVYYPSVIWKRLGQRTRDKRHSLTQFMFFYEPRDGSDRLQGQFYSYRSLLNFKLVKESPLARRESIQLMQMLQPYFSILGLHHSDRPGPSKFLKLNNNDLSIHYTPTEEESQVRRKGEKELLRLLPRLGAFPLKRIDPGFGSSIHYGGTLPMGDDDLPFTTTLEGILRGGFGRVRVVDGATFPSLPAKGLTLTLMANARRIAELIPKD